MTLVQYRDRERNVGDGGLLGIRIVFSVEFAIGEDSTFDCWAEFYW